MFAGFASPKKQNQNPEPDTLPTFGSQGKRFRVVTNDTVVLPCDVINPGEYDFVENKYIFLFRFFFPPPFVSRTDKKKNDIII